PYITRPATSLKPQPLPTRIHTPEFEFELQRLVICESGSLFINGVDYRVRRAEPRSRFFAGGAPTTRWRIGHYWFEDPYGNRYDAHEPPPWHYPYWVFCAKVYGSAGTASGSKEAWQSQWLDVRLDADTPINTSLTRQGVTIDLLGLAAYPNMVLEIDASNPTRYRIRTISSENFLDDYTPTTIDPSADALIWRIATRVPVVLFRVRVTHGGNTSWGMAEDGAFMFNDRRIYLSFRDAQGRSYPAQGSAFNEDSRFTSLLVAMRADSLPKTVRQVQLSVEVRSAHEIRLPVPPMSKEQVLEAWRREAISRGSPSPTP
ncbi:MAG: hypothetical protein N2651_01055, partial [Fimbriimonadales bacterium]|nr:hypothetical protein [Fimbriimonadales bacterium]